MDDGDDSPEDDVVKRCKVWEISPTIPFEPLQVDPDELSLMLPVLRTQDLDQCVFQGRFGTVTPSCGALDELDPHFLPPQFLTDWETNRLVQLAGMIPCQILHEQKLWAEFVWIPKRASVQFAIQQALPHAKSFHFQLIQMGIHELTFDDRIEEEHQCTVMVDTVKLERCVKPDFHELALLVTVDVCWKFSDLIAFVACECRELPSKVIILDGDSPMPEGAFVLQQLCSSFRATIFVNPLDTRQLIPKKLCDFGQAKDIRVAGVKVANPIFTDNALPSDSGFIRFAVRNPKWGSIRSVAVHNKTPLQCLVSMLLPDFDEPIPYITAQSVILDQSMPVCQLLEYEDIELHFSGFKPWPVTNLEYLIPFAPLVPQDPQFTVKIWVKGPFDYRAKICHVDKEWSVTKLAASYQVLHKSNLTMIAMQHGKAVDTRLQVQDLCLDHELQIRVCALPGGAKSEDLQRFLEPLLTKRGVLESAVKSRVQTILSKIDNATIRAHMHDDPQTFWGYLKQWANDAKLRLITPEELKAQKKAGRLEAKEHSSASSSVKNKKLSEATAEKVAIDTLHFVANNAAVKQIDLNGFAPDRTGIAIVTPEEAMKCLPVRNISVEPLALIVLTPFPFGGMPTVSVPAIDGKSNPIVVPVVILNFGEPKVEFKPKLPQTKLIGTPVVVLELIIRKELVTAWSEVQSPLAYLGLHIPEMRRDAVIEAWSLFPYGSHRWKTQHDHASYVHGFCKVKATAADQILKRSGHAGIFLAPKTPDKKKDLSYSLIQIPGKTLDEVICLSKDVPHTLGVVECMTNYAVRTRREHVHEVRAKILPQSISILEGQVQTDADWYLLKGLKDQTTHDILTKTLQDLGWNQAVAIRPTRGGAWLINAKDDPPFGHFQINETYVSVTKFNRKQDVKHSPAPSDMKFQLMHSSVPATPAASTCSDTSRYDELQERLTTIINDKFAEKMNETQQQIQGLNTAVQNLEQHGSQQKAAILELKRSQEECVGKVNTMQQSMQSAISDGNAAIIQQMDKLFAHFNKNVDSRLAAIESKVDDADPCKRAKVSQS